MNKSTPINQLPSVQQSQQQFITEQQQNIVNQAKNAISNMNMPQNTQILNELVEDPDESIQEVLNSLNLNSSSSNSLEQFNNNNMNHHNPVTNYNQNNILPSNQQQYNLDNYNQNPINNWNSNYQMPSNNFNSFDTFIKVFGDDIKLALLVFVSVIIVNFMPIIKFLNNYISLDKIPNNEILIKASVIAIIVIFFKKFVIT